MGLLINMNTVDMGLLISPGKLSKILIPRDVYIYIVMSTPDL